MLAGVGHVFARSDVPIVAAADGRSVAGIPKENGAHGAIGALDSQHGDIPIHRAVWIVTETYVVAFEQASIDRESGAPRSLLENGWLTIGKRGAHDLDEFRPERLAVSCNSLPFLGRWLNHVRERLFQHRGRMCVAGNDRDAARAELVFLGELLKDGLHEGMTHFAVVERDKHESFAGRILQGQSLNEQRMIHLVRGPLASRVTGQTDRQLWCDIAHGEADFRGRIRQGGCDRPQERRLKYRQPGNVAGEQRRTKSHAMYAKPSRR